MLCYLYNETLTDSEHFCRYQKMNPINEPIARDSLEENNSNINRLHILNVPLQDLAPEDSVTFIGRNVPDDLSPPPIVVEPAEIIVDQISPDLKQKIEKVTETKKKTARKPLGDITNTVNEKPVAAVKPKRVTLKPVDITKSKLGIFSRGKKSKSIPSIDIIIIFYKFTLIL